ncbi:hypothetical protein ScPMuIL_002695 [Solemya velum]
MTMDQRRALYPLGHGGPRGITTVHRQFAVHLHTPKVEPKSVSVGLELGRVFDPLVALSRRAQRLALRSLTRRINKTGGLFVNKEKGKSRHIVDNDPEHRVKADSSIPLYFHVSILMGESKLTYPLTSAVSAETLKLKSSAWPTRLESGGFKLTGEGRQVANDCDKEEMIWFVGAETNEKSEGGWLRMDTCVREVRCLWLFGKRFLIVYRNSEFRCRNTHQELVLFLKYPSCRIPTMGSGSTRERLAAMLFGGWENVLDHYTWIWVSPPLYLTIDATLTSDLTTRTTRP